MNPTRHAAAIALNRFGLGARPDEPLPADPKRWLLAQFESYQPLPPAWAQQPSSAALVVSYAELQRGVREAGATTEVAARQALATEVRDRYRAAVDARVTSALVTPAPFAERLVHFWANHFAVSIEKPTLGSIAGSFEAEAIRPHVFGRFEDMLLAVERHPAMLLYLDQVRSIGPESTGARRAAGVDPERRRGLNENLAREVLELHTLGVRSGYSQDRRDRARARSPAGPSVRCTGLMPAAPAPSPAASASSRCCTSPARAWCSASATKLPAKARQRRSCATSLPWQATAPHRHQAGAPFRRRRAGAGAGRASADAFERGRGDLPGVYRALIESPEARSGAGQVQDAVGMDAVVVCAASAGATCTTARSPRC
jgi:uncharacterized protein (DUF1800 family)